MTVCAPLAVSLPWCVTARCPIVDPDLTPEWSDIPVLVGGERSDGSPTSALSWV